MQLPPYTLEESSPDRLVLALSLKESMACFEGHFNGLPVLAGVVQLGWALSLANRHFERPLVFQSMRSTKFQQLVRPPASLTLTLELKDGGKQLRFRYLNRRGVCSSGALWVTDRG